MSVRWVSTAPVALPLLCITQQGSNSSLQGCIIRERCIDRLWSSNIRQRSCGESWTCWRSTRRATGRALRVKGPGRDESWRDVSTSAVLCFTRRWRRKRSASNRSAMSAFASCKRNRVESSKNSTRRARELASRKWKPNVVKVCRTCSTIRQYRSFGSLIVIYSG